MGRQTIPHLKLCGETTILHIGGGRVKVHGEKAMYPDFSCYPHFNNETRSPRYGRGRIEAVMEKCEKQPKDEEDPNSCYKTCVLTSHGIISGTDGIYHISLFYDSQRIFNQAANKAGWMYLMWDVGKKVAHTCGHLKEERTELYECVEKAVEECDAELIAKYEEINYSNVPGGYGCYNGYYSGYNYGYYSGFQGCGNSWADWL